MASAGRGLSRRALRKPDRAGRLGGNRPSLRERGSGLRPCRHRFRSCRSGAAVVFRRRRSGRGDPPRHRGARCAAAEGNGRPRQCDRPARPAGTGARPARTAARRACRARHRPRHLSRVRDRAASERPGGASAVGARLALPDDRALRHRQEGRGGTADRDAERRNPRPLRSGDASPAPGRPASAGRRSARAGAPAAPGAQLRAARGEREAALSRRLWRHAVRFAGDPRLARPCARVRLLVLP